MQSSRKQNNEATPRPLNHSQRKAALVLKCLAFTTGMNPRSLRKRCNLVSSVGPSRKSANMRHMRRRIDEGRIPVPAGPDRGAYSLDVLVSELRTALDVEDQRMGKLPGVSEDSVNDPNVPVWLTPTGPNLLGGLFNGTLPTCGPLGGSWPCHS